MANIAGQTIVITGSSRGMGAAAARILCARGANVVLHGRTESEPLHLLAKELDAPYLVCDVSDEVAITDQLEQVIGGAQVHGLINSAGQATPKPFFELTDDDWKREFDVNVFGTINFIKAIAPKMVGHKYGRIVNVSSLRATPEKAHNRAVHYAASKAVIENLTTTMAKEFAPYVNVNCIRPGFILTDMSTTWTSQMHQLANNAIAERAGTPEEVGEAMAFLVSPEASFITAQVLSVDGGYAAAGL